MPLPKREYVLFIDGWNLLSKKPNETRKDWGRRNKSFFNCLTISVRHAIRAVGGKVVPKSSAWMTGILLIEAEQVMLIALLKHPMVKKITVARPICPE